MLHITVLAMLIGLAASDFDEKLHNKYMTLPRADFVEYFNKQDFSWKIKHNENINPIMGLSTSLKLKSLPLQYHDLKALEDLPENFDARENWPHCDSIKEIYHQQNCSVCWAIAGATTASDRTCIHKNENVRLSIQDLECSRPNGTNFCTSLGDQWDALEFWKDFGLVTEDCKTYDENKLLVDNCLYACVDNSINYTNDKHFADKIYEIPNEDDQIKAELFKNGPIATGFSVYDDLLDYHQGVYEHKYGEFKGGHSVRVIGYGVEDGIDYWLVANSWGITWGVNGLFKIKRFQLGLDFEKNMYSGFPKK